MKRLFVFLMAALLTYAVWGQSTQSAVTYYYPEYNTANVPTSGIKTWHTANCTTYTDINQGDYSGNQTWSSGWYYVKNTQETIGVDGSITCSGDVHVIMGTGTKLSVNYSGEKSCGGFVVEGNSTLTIYTQDTTVAGRDSLFINGDDGHSAIGGSSGSSNGTITINGCYVEANGGSNAAGIGGGNGKSSGAIIINGGTVVAKSAANGAGIGGGYCGDGENITINGGRVVAYSCVKGAGIGGGCYDVSGSSGVAKNITINGGEVTAFGGTTGTTQTAYGAGADGIGRGYTDHTAGSNSYITIESNNIVKARQTINSTEVTLTLSGSETWETKLNNYRYINIKFIPKPPVAYLKPIYISSGADSLGKGISGWETRQCKQYALITSSTTTMGDGWYVAQGAGAITASSITCNGNAHLILTDGAYFTVTTGLTISQGKSLTIYAQSRDTLTMGRVVVRNGGTSGTVSGTIVINGGFVVATNPNFAVDGSSNVYVNHGVVYVNCSTSTIGQSGGVYFNDIMMVRADDNSLPVRIVRHANCSTSVRGSLSGKKFASAMPVNIFKKAGDWNVAGNWYDNKVPSATEDVAVYAACGIPANVTAVCRDLCIYSPVTLQASSALYAGQISNPDAANLVLQQDADSSSTVYFTSGSPKATVEMYIKGKSTPETKGGTTYQNPEWQYRGFVGTPDASQSLADVHIYKWDETKNGSSPWLTPDKYEPWNGYCMANWTENAGLTRSYSTTLSPIADKDTTMSRTITGTGSPKSENRGVNLLTNSMSAPIDLTKSSSFTYSNVQQTFYFFQTRSHEAWKKNPTASILAYPTQTGESVYGTANSSIPAGGSFAVRVDSNSTSNTTGKLTIPAAAYQSAASGAMYKPAKPMPVVSVRVESESAGDELFLVVSEVCGRWFDNGYDGTKMFASDAPQVYATNDYGLTAVNADSTLLGQYVGYRGVGGKITVSLHVRDLEGYRELYLYDRVKGNYMKFGEDTLRYEVEVSGSDEPQRFQICGVKENGYKFMAAEEPRVDIVGNVAWLVNMDRGERVIRVLDAAGRTLWSENATGRDSVELPELPAGVYFVNCGGATGKWISK